MADLQDRDDRLAEQLDHLQGFRQVERADHADLHPLVEQRLDDPAAAQFEQIEMDGGVGPTERQDAARNAGGERRRGGEADLQLAHLALVRPPRQQHRLVDLLEDLPGLVEEQPAGFGQAHAAIGAIQQARADFFLQGLDLLAQRRLGNAQLLGGAAEMQFLGDGDEVAQVSQFHLSPIDSKYISNVSINILEIINFAPYSFHTSPITTSHPDRPTLGAAAAGRSGQSHRTRGEL
ncbi:hypothetical protein D3C76_1085390 [compost metagenome]